MGAESTVSSVTGATKQHFHYLHQKFYRLRNVRAGYVLYRALVKYMSSIAKMGYWTQLYIISCNISTKSFIMNFPLTVNIVLLQLGFYQLVKNGWGVNLNNCYRIAGNV